ncbi:MAG: hypothetical protein AAF307_09500 [Pseudomonadota bacterium]
MEGGADDPQLAIVLQRVSKRLDWLADAVHSIEHAIGEELGPQNALPVENIQKLQQLDLIRQTLEDLSILSLAMSDGRVGHVGVSVAQKLRLAATKDILGPQEPQNPAANSADDLGAVDLF